MCSLRNPNIWLLNYAKQFLIFSFTLLILILTAYYIVEYTLIACDVIDSVYNFSLKQYISVAALQSQYAFWDGMLKSIELAEELSQLVMVIWIENLLIAINDVYAVLGTYIYQMFYSAEIELLQLENAVLISSDDSLENAVEAYLKLYNHNKAFHEYFDLWLEKSWHRQGHKVEPYFSLVPESVAKNFLALRLVLNFSNPAIKSYDVAAEFFPYFFELYPSEHFLRWWVPRYKSHYLPPMSETARYVLWDCEKFINKFFLIDLKTLICDLIRMLEGEIVRGIPVMDPDEFSEQLFRAIEERENMTEYQWYKKQYDEALLKGINLGDIFRPQRPGVSQYDLPDALSQYEKIELNKLLANITTCSRYDYLRIFELGIRLDPDAFDEVSEAFKAANIDVYDIVRTDNLPPLYLERNPKFFLTYWEVEELKALLFDVSNRALIHYHRILELATRLPQDQFDKVLDIFTAGGVDGYSLMQLIETANVYAEDDCLSCRRYPYDPRSETAWRNDLQIEEMRRGIELQYEKFSEWCSRHGLPRLYSIAFFHETLSFTGKQLLNYWQNFSYWETFSIANISYENWILYNLFGLILLKLMFTPIIYLKFLYFFILLILGSYWGFLYSFDGLIFILLLTEFTLLFIFLLIYTTVLSRYTAVSLKRHHFFYMLIILNFIFFSNLGSGIELYLIKYYTYTTFTRYIVSSDFFIFFYFFFYLHPQVIALIALLLGFFSIFFIFIFFLLKIKSIQRIKYKQQLFLLRKQNLVHQSSSKSTLRTFQK